jgi:hypothetical protein
LWSVEGRFHHDLCVHDDEIHALSRVPERVAEIHPELPILVDQIVVLSMDGEVLREISVLDVIRDSAYATLLPSVWHERSDERIELDLLHTNHVEVFDGRAAERHPLFRRGNLLDDGNILLFDNGTERSRVLELDPLTARIVWSYGPPEGFFSGSRGSNQRLPNGNTLITESNTGRVFEVTPDGRRVWEFANPAINDEQVREAIWRMTRFDPETLAFLR